MSDKLIKPYEISVWEEELVTVDGNSYYEENKLAIIGSNTMTGPNKVYEPIFNKKSNGEKSLTFSLHYKYFDPYSENLEVINPFAVLLTNERKVKLKYDNKWYDFIIKEHTESSDGLVWTYSCVDAFVLELSKTGYDITFDSELGNNQGTARQLATKVLEGTDWTLGNVGIELQKISEPIYQATLQSTTDISIINASGDGVAIPTAGTPIYVFYSNVANKDGKYLHFIVRHNDNSYVVDDNNTIIATNFRINTSLTYEATNRQFKNGSTVIISLGNIETQYQAYRLTYNILTTYDPVMKRTVEVYKYNQQEVYSYKDDTYTTSDIITNYFTNGDNFNSFEDGSVQGWDPYVSKSTGSFTPLNIVTRPALNSSTQLVSLASISAAEGFLEVKFPGICAKTSSNANYLKNAIYNSGFEDNVNSIGSIKTGQQFILRYRAGYGDSVNSLYHAFDLRAVVAGYTESLVGGYYVKTIDKNNIILWFDDYDNSHRKTLNNIISTGNMVNGKYIIDDVIQTPSTNYIYKDKTTGTRYVWDLSSQSFVTEANGHVLPYYYWTATARKSVSNKTLTDPNTKIGLFVYTIGRTDLTPMASKKYYINDIQLFPLEYDGNGEIVTIGNVPEATTTTHTYYYSKPHSGQTDVDVELYTTIGALKTAKGWSSNPVPIRSSEKILSISESQSNCFNILQSIAETFECWVDLDVVHDQNTGKIIINNGKPSKYVHLREYIGENNYAGFKYAINLNTIERTVNSDEIVTKLIVEQTQNDNVPEGYVSIQNASSNPSRESYILNFDYFLKQGLIKNKTACQNDLTNFYTSVRVINDSLYSLEKRRNELENAVTELGSKQNVYTELVSEAKKDLNEALEEFKKCTGQTYEAYRVKHPTLEDKYTDDENVLDILGTIYTCSSVINSNSGLLSQITSEYTAKRKELKGSESFKVTVSVEYDSLSRRHVVVQMSDYLVGTTFMVGDETLTVTTGEKDFDVQTGSVNFRITTVPTGYTAEATHNIKDNEVATYRIKSNSTVVGIEDKIEDKIKEKKNLVDAFTNKYRRFIQEGTWNSSDYIDSELYYLDALQVSNTSANPVVTYSINVVEISQLEGFEWYKFDVGDKTYIEDTEFFGWTNKDGNLTPAREEVTVSEVEWHLDEPDQNVITVQNYKTRFEDLFQRISATVQTVQYNEASYPKISSFINPDGTLNQDVLVQSLNNVKGKSYALTSDGSVMIDGDQIIIRNLTNSSNIVRINSAGLGISSDGGLTWSTAISGRGINIGTVYTGRLNTDEVIIGSNKNPSFRWDKSGISAYGSTKQLDEEGQEVDVYDLQKYVRYDQYGLYGIKDGEFFKAESLQDVLDNAHFAVTWDGFFIKNSYEGGGRVEITSDNDFRVLSDPYLQGNFQEKIKIGALEWGEGITSPDTEGATALPTLYGIRIKNDAGAEVMKTDDDGNITISGTINANAGNFDGLVTVGKDENNNFKPYIIIDGRDNEDATISSSKYVQDGASYGWMINADGDAVFNNITARGAIKTAVFEYAEIQAVGGVFIFRPSSTIKSAQVSGNDLILTVEKPVLFKDGQWCKISNYTNSGEATDPDITNILLNNGLTHVYRVSRTQGSNNITLVGAAAMVVGQDAVTTVERLVGGALVDMGNKANGDGRVGTSNYGIGINSSDNTVNLPARAISLFETVIDETKEPKVSYKYRGILGTLPTLSATDVNDSIYNQNIAGTQGIYTNNMYIGDKKNFITYYYDKTANEYKLIINADTIYEGYDEEGQPIPVGGDGKDGEDAITVIIDSSSGNMFVRQDIRATLTCHVYQGSGMDPEHEITDQVTRFTWTKYDKDGIKDETWARLPGGQSITIGPEDVASKAIFKCEVEF